jgi:predicted enzyme related to lactoylglutathione lyase
MPQSARLAGVELYFNDLEAAKTFYRDVMGLALDEDDPHHHAKFGLGSVFLCLEAKGVEGYASMDKAVVFVEVADIRAAMDRIDSRHLVGSDLSSSHPWVAIRDPEGHTVMLLQTP